MANPLPDHSVSVEEAMARLDVIPDYDAGNGPGPCVHTLMQARNGMLLGAHWYLPSVRQEFERWGVQQAGEEATASGHGLVAVEGAGPTIFFGTQSQGASDESQPTPEAT